MTPTSRLLRLIPALLLISTSGWAQSAGPAPGSGAGNGPGTQIQGTVQTFTAPLLTLIDKDGKQITVSLPADLRIQVSVSRSLADIKAGDFVGSAAVLGDDGKRYAEEVHYIPEAMRAQVEGHRQMDSNANRTMTNATVAQVVRNAGAQGGEELTLKYSGGEKTLIVKPGTPIVAMETGNADMLKPGVTVNITINQDAQQSIRGIRIIK